MKEAKPMSSLEWGMLEPFAKEAVEYTVGWLLGWPRKKAVDTLRRRIMADFTKDIVEPFFMELREKGPMQ